MNFPPYFTTTPMWSDFWMSAQSDLIDSFVLYDQRIFVWHGPLTSRFWYIPHLSISKKTELNKLIALAKKQGITWVSMECAENFDIALLPPHREQPFKKLQYNATITLDTSTFISAVNLEQVYDQNYAYFLGWNATARRKLKKAMSYEWQVATEKTPQALIDFLTIYHDTSARQHFAVHPDSYYRALFLKPESRIIVLKNPQGVVCGSWFGYVSQDTLTYLYGGNTAEALEHNGQYAIQLAALNMVKYEHLRWYDLGGYEKNTGYGRFKEGFHGTMRQFAGPYDIVIDPLKYSLVITAKKIQRGVKKLWSR